MLGHQFAHSSAPIRKVKEVQFGILSPEEIVSDFYLLRFPLKFSWRFVRKRIPLSKSSIQRSWMRPAIDLSLVV